MSTISTLPTPFGDLTVVTDEGAVIASGLAEPGALLAPVPGAAPTPGPAPDWVAGPLARYLDGVLAALAEVPVAIPEHGFQGDAWRALHAVPAGETVSYAELAAAAGSPRAVRAAGTACARNRLAPFVPCHRVVRSDGTLGKYGYGAEVKQALLTHEGAL
jgi:methylated-DNA-[protein]-cysteine S-methyltransferase